MPASTDLGRLLVHLGLDRKQFDRELNSTRRRVQRTAREFRTLFAGIGLGLATREVFQASQAADRISGALRVATGSAQAAQREFGFLRRESERLGLDFRVTAREFSSLAAAARGTALEGSATRDIFLGIAEASTALRLDAQQTGGALTAIEQIISKGRVSAEELRQQLGERLPGAFQIAARSIGVTTERLDEMLEAGELTAQQLLPRLAAELRSTFGPEAARAASGTTAELNRFRNAIFDVELAFARSGFVEGLTEGLGGIRDVLKDPAVERGLRQIGSLLGTIGEQAAGAAENLDLIVASLSTLAGLRLAGPLGAIAGALVGIAAAEGIRNQRRAMELLGISAEEARERIAELTAERDRLLEFGGATVQPTRLAEIDAELERLQQGLNAASQFDAEQLAAQLGIAFDPSVMRTFTDATEETDEALADLADTVDKDVQKALDSIASTIQGVRDELLKVQAGDFVADLVVGFREIRADAEKAGLSIEETNRLLSEFVDVSLELSRAKPFKDAAEKLREIGDEALRLRVGDFQADLFIGIREIEKAAEKANLSLAETQKLVGDFVQARTDLRVAEKAHESAEQVQQLWDNAAENIQRAWGDTFTEIFRHGVRSFSDLKDRVKDILARLAGEATELLVFRPIFQAVVGSSPLASLFGGAGVVSEAAPALAGLASDVERARIAAQIGESVQEGSEKGTKAGAFSGLRSALSSLLGLFGGGQGGAGLFNFGGLFGGAGGGLLGGGLGLFGGLAGLGIGIIARLGGSNPSLSTAVGLVSGLLVGQALHSLAGSLIGLGINTSGSLGGALVQGGVGLSRIAGSSLLGPLGAIGGAAFAYSQARDDTARTAAIVSGVGALIGSYFGPIGTLAGSLAGGAVYGIDIAKEVTSLSKFEFQQKYGDVGAGQAFKDVFLATFSPTAGLAAAVYALTSGRPHRVGTGIATTAENLGLAETVQTPFGFVGVPSPHPESRRRVMGLPGIVQSIDEYIAQFLSPEEISTASGILQQNLGRTSFFDRPGNIDNQINRLLSDRVRQILESLPEVVSAAPFLGVPDQYGPPGGLTPQDLAVHIEGFFTQLATFRGNVRVLSGEYIPQLEQSIGSLNERFNEASDHAKQFGFNVDLLTEALEKGREKLFADFIRDLDIAILQYRDPVAAAIAQQQIAAEQRLAEARIAGAEAVAKAEELNALEVSRIYEQAGQPIRDLLNQLTGTTSSPLARETVLANAEQAFSEARARVLAGETVAIGDLVDSARNLIDVSQEAFGSTATFFERFNFVVATLQNVLGGLPQFAQGGSFIVPGSGGVDSQLIAFRASPGERVTVETAAQVARNVISLSDARMARGLPGFQEGGSFTIHTSTPGANFFEPRDDKELLRESARGNQIARKGYFMLSQHLSELRSEVGSLRADLRNRDQRIAELLSKKGVA